MREITYLQALTEALREEMHRDPGVFIMGEDIGLHGGIFQVTKGLFQEFGPKRVRNTPISEAGFVGAAIGASVTGTRPVAELMYVDFTAVAMDQIVNQMAKLRYMFGGKAKLPVVIRTQQGGGRGNAAQHSQSLEAWFTHVPGIKVVLPSTPKDAKGLLKTAIRDDNPVLFLEHKLLYATKGIVPDGDYTIPFGQAEVKREGKNVTLVSYSLMLLKTLKAAEELAKEGIDAEVIDLKTLVPLDLATVIQSVKKTGRLVTYHEAHRRCGAGADLAAQVMEDAFDYLDAPVQRVAALDVPIPYSGKLEMATLPQERDVIEAVKRII